LEKALKSIAHLGAAPKRDRSNSLSDSSKDMDTRISVPSDDLIALDDNFALFANHKIEHTKTDATTIDQLLSLEIDDPLSTMPSPRSNHHSQDTNINSQTRPTRSNSHNNVHLLPPIEPIQSTSPPISPRKPNNINSNILTPTIATIPPSPTTLVTPFSNSNNNVNSSNLGSAKLSPKKVSNSPVTDLPSLVNVTPPPVPPRVRPVSSTNIGNGILTPSLSPLATIQVGNKVETKPLASPASESKKEKKKPSNPFDMLDNE